MLEKQPIFSKDDLVLGLGPNWKNAVTEAEMGKAEPESGWGRAEEGLRQGQGRQGRAEAGRDRAGGEGRAGGAGEAGGAGGMRLGPEARAH